MVGRLRCIARTCIVPTARSENSRVLGSISTFTVSLNPFTTRKVKGKLLTAISNTILHKCRLLQSSSWKISSNTLHVNLMFSCPGDIIIGNNCSNQEQEVLKRDKMWIHSYASQKKKENCKKRERVALRDEKAVRVQSFGIKFNHSVISIPKHCVT